MSALKAIWILTDGKIGDLVQCRGIAERLNAETVRERVVEAAGVWGLPLPWMPVAPAQRPDRPNSPIASPYPDLVVASGRRTLPYLRHIRAAAPETKIAFLKDPRWTGRGVADVIWAPAHDRLANITDRVFTTDTSPHGLNEERLADARASVRAGVRAHAGTYPQFPDSITAPATGIILGGDSGSVRWTSQNASAFAELLRDSLAGETGSVLITTSRRTPQVLRDAVVAALPQAWLDGDGTAYLPILATANRLIVTGDSHNMVSETLATGVPVYVYRPPGLQKKLHAFLNAMEQRDAVRPLSAPLQIFAGKRIDASAEIAAYIRKAVL